MNFSIPFHLNDDVLKLIGLQISYIDWCNLLSSSKDLYNYFSEHQYKPKRSGYKTIKTLFRDYNPDTCLKLLLNNTSKAVYNNIFLIFHLLGSEFKKIIRHACNILNSHYKTTKFAFLNINKITKYEIIYDIDELWALNRKSYIRYLVKCHKVGETLNPYTNIYVDFKLKYAIKYRKQSLLVEAKYNRPGGKYCDTINQSISYDFGKRQDEKIFKLIGTFEVDYVYLLTAAIKYNNNVLVSDILSHIDPEKRNIEIKTDIFFSLICFFRGIPDDDEINEILKQSIKYNNSTALTLLTTYITCHNINVDFNVFLFVTSHTMIKLLLELGYTWIHKKFNLQAIQKISRRYIMKLDIDYSKYFSNMIWTDNKVIIVKHSDKKVFEKILAVYDKSTLPEIRYE